MARKQLTDTILKAALILALAMVGATGYAHADVYKWVDANGHVQFSDKPPPDQKNVKQLDIKDNTPSAADKAAAEKRAADAKARLKTVETGGKAPDKPKAADPDEGKSAYQKSEECYAKYRLGRGRYAPEAAEKCQDVKAPE